MDPWRAVLGTALCPAMQRSERRQRKRRTGPRCARRARCSMSTLGRGTACTSVARTRRTSLRSCLMKLPARCAR
eukprot:6612898-Pyramimonas_sp.AAC.1